MLTNKYSKTYFAITANAKQRITEGYTEHHHIIPESLGGPTTDLSLSTDMVAGIYDTSGNFSNECTPFDNLITETGLLYIGIATGPVTWGLTNWTTTGGTVPVAPDNTFQISYVS